MLITDETLLNYKRCSRRTFLDNYGNPEDKNAKKDFVLKLKEESEKHCQSILTENYPLYHQPKTSINNSYDLPTKTLLLMRQGVDCIYKGKLKYSSLENITYLASPTLLIKQPIPSIFGDWSYYPISIQIGRLPKPEYKIIAGFQAFLLINIQGISPQYAEIILRQKNIYKVNLNIWLSRSQEVITKCTKMLWEKKEPEVFISRQRCSLCRWYNSCYAIAKSEKHLSLIPGITPNRYELLQKKGISTIESLSKINPQDFSELIDLEIVDNLQKQAQAMVTNIPIVKGNSNPKLPSNSIELYFDIEAEPDRNIDYLLGVLLVDKTNNDQKYYSFLAKTLKEEQIIWEQFLDFVNIYTESPIFHYSNYEVKTLKRLAEIYNTPKEKIDHLLPRLIDLHEQVLSSVILPVESYSLKSIANWLGFDWRNPFTGDHMENGMIISGDQSVCWYDQWLKTGDHTHLNCILRYNEDDCKATYHLKNWLVNFFQN